ncbi:ABC transporter permease [Candidatus Geothermarchaeota archaeon]|nr:MAG: ABC transporter permease [Candidatus Geothermarchaeota archaeon]
MFKIEVTIKKRSRELPYSGFIIPLSSIIISILISLIILGFYNVNPEKFFKVFTTALISPSSVRYAIPLTLSGVGLAVAYKANVWNIGAEGQILAGALAASGLALYYIPPTMPSEVAILILYISAFLAGSLTALIPAILKALYDVNEVLSTLMINYVMMQIVNYLVYGPWRGKKEYGYPRTDIFPDNTILPQLEIGGLKTTINIPTLILTIASAILMYVILFKTKWGYEIRVYGLSEEAARYGGLEIWKIIILVMVISGGLAGLAGAGEVLGVYKQLIRAERVSAGFGYTAIIVAWLGNLNPLGILLSGYFIGVLVSMGYTLQIFTGVPYGTVNIFTGTLLLTLISLDFLSKYSPVIRVRR